MRHLIFLAVGASSFLSSCGATLSPAASKIQVHTQISTALDTCKKLGPVMATYKKRPFVDSEPFLFAALRDETSKLGGDSLALLQRDDVGNEAIRHGVAYKCF
jgi:hypothetical protein